MKKSIKLLISFFVVLLTVAGYSTPALADVVFEPMNSDFYNKHSDECYTCERVYIVNGPDGTVTIYKSPETNKVEGTLNNGDSIMVQYIYTGGEVEWGYVENWSTNSYGWVPMPYLQEQYDASAFRDQHYEQIINEGWMLDGKFCDVDIYIWDYPGDPKVENTLVVSSDDNVMAGGNQYTDEFGNQWGYFNYYYAWSGWICLNNPTASYDELYPNGGPEYKLDSEKEDDNSNISAIEPAPSGPIVPKRMGLNPVEIVLIGTLVAAVIVATVIILVFLGKKKKEK